MVFSRQHGQVWWSYLVQPSNRTALHSYRTASILPEHIMDAHWCYHTLHQQQKIRDFLCLYWWGNWGMVQLKQIGSSFRVSHAPNWYKGKRRCCNVVLGIVVYRLDTPELCGFELKTPAVLSAHPDKTHDQRRSCPGPWWGGALPCFTYWLVILGLVSKSSSGWKTFPPSYKPLQIMFYDRKAGRTLIAGDE